MNKLLICMAVACVTAFNAAAQSFSAATYNIRQLNAKDTAEGNGWERRLPVISSLIRFHDFDIFGAQEVFHSQLQGMLAALPGYDYVGVGRDDGAEAGEYAAVFYKKDRFQLLDSGHFWLSEEPSRPSKGWDAKYVRICCWGRFLDRESGERFWFFTLHTDHKGRRAQVESCRLVVDRIRTMCRGERAVLTDPDRKTFRCIDYLFVTEGFRVLRYGILTDTYRTKEPAGSAKPYRARTPSDHFPVQVELTFAE